MIWNPGSIQPTRDEKYWTFYSFVKGEKSSTFANYQKGPLRVFFYFLWTFGFVQFSKQGDALLQF